jgi:hypothetical protein
MTFPKLLTALILAGIFGRILMSNGIPHLIPSAVAFVFFIKLFMPEPTNKTMGKDEDSIN